MAAVEQPFAKEREMRAVPRGSFDDAGAARRVYPRWDTRHRHRLWHGRKLRGHMVGEQEAHRDNPGRRNGQQRRFLRFACLVPAHTLTASSHEQGRAKGGR